MDAAELKRDVPPARTAQRRHLTILFADLSDSTTFAGSIEPEKYLEILEYLDRCSRRIIESHGGTIVDFRGDGFLAMFGAPAPSEDDGRRATEAALELHEAIRQWRPPLQALGVTSLSLHSGIHSGLVLLLDGHPPGRVSLIGEAPSVAARLSDEAGPNEILVSETTLGVERHFFNTLDRGFLSLQGKTERVATFEVLGRSRVNTRYEARAQRGLTPFAGRTDAIRLMEEALQTAAGGRARRVSVVAAAGIGKTRLVEEFLPHAAAGGWRICRGYCEPAQRGEPLQPLLQMLRALCGLERGTSAVSAEALEQLLGGLDAELSAHRDGLQRAASASLLARTSEEEKRRRPRETLDALGAVFSALGRSRPLAIFVDDWQWADDATREVLGALGELTDVRMLLLTASRERGARESGLSDADVVELTPLSAPEAAATIRALRPDADPFRVRDILQLSGGNPLYIEELCQSSVIERGYEQGGHGDHRPAWLSTLIESRVARLTPELAELVRVASVVGTVVPTQVLTRITGCLEPERLPEKLRDVDLLLSGETAGTLRFKHGITRDVIYDSVGLDQRQALHRRIAGCLEELQAEGSQDDLSGTLAYHYAESADHEKAAHYAELAGNKAMAASALDRARRLYGDALAALQNLEPSERNYRRWMSIAQRFGLACVYDPMRSQLAVFERASTLAAERGDDAATARAEYWLGYINYGLGDTALVIHHAERARDRCSRALATARATDAAPLAAEMEGLAAGVMATLGQAHLAACDHDTALAQLNESVEMRRRVRRLDRTTVGSAYAIACKGAVLGDRGRFAEAHLCFQEALDAVHDVNHAVKGSVLTWQSAVLAWQGRWSEALETATRAHAVAERIESLYVLGMSRTIIEYTRWMLEERADAVNAMVRATAWLESSDKRMFISVFHGWLAGAMMSLGREGEAREYVARAFRRARKQDRLGLANAYQVLSSIPAGARRGLDPERCLARAMALARARGSAREEAMTLLHLARFCAARGARADASRHAEQAAQLFQALEMPWHVAETLRVVSLHGLGCQL